MTAVSTVTSHTISLHLQNRSGVLNRVVLTFSRRGWNIDSLSVSHELDDSTSRCSIVASGDSATLNLIVSQLKKLIDVIDAYEEEPGESTERELALFRVMLHADDADIETVLGAHCFDVSSAGIDKRSTKSLILGRILTEWSRHSPNSGA